MIKKYLYEYSISQYGLLKPLKNITKPISQYMEPMPLAVKPYLVVDELYCIFVRSFANYYARYVRGIFSEP